MQERSAVPEGERGQANSAPLPAADPARGSGAWLLGLQRTAGNRAVTAMVARMTPTRASLAASAAVLDPEEKAFDAALRVGDWETAAASLVNVATPTTRLWTLTVEQLRLLQDAVFRGRDRLGVMGGAIDVAIALELQSRGVPAAKVPLGAAFGKLDFTVTERTNGNKATGDAYGYGIQIAFTPDTAVVDADEIGFVQTVRVVDSRTGADKEQDWTSKKRQTASDTSVDRVRGNELGWYGMLDDGTAEVEFVPWPTGDPKTAFMVDRPSWVSPNTTFTFETLAVCTAGADVGKVYAAVTWGFTVDEELRITDLPRNVTNKQSPEATAAVEAWNAQSAGAKANRNAPHQKPLPALR